MSRIALLLIGAVVLGALVTRVNPAPAAPAGQRPIQFVDAIGQGRSLVTDLMKQQGLPGFSIAVAVDGKVVWSEGFGLADLENNVPVSTATSFRIGSVSKLLTAAAVARLYEEKLIDLDVPVQTYVPAFPRKEQEITVRQLAGHLSGIRHYSRDEFIARQGSGSVTESLKVFQDSPLLFPPGAKYAYSTFGYVLLSAVIEGASKENFLTYMRGHVFRPLGMENTRPDEVQALVPHRSRFYSKDEKGQLVNAPYTDNSSRWAAAGFLSTAEDLTRFGSALLTDGFLKPETRTVMFTSQHTNDGKETGVGLAWRIGTDEKGRRILHHGGDSLGGRAFILMYPEQRVVVAMLSNLSFARFAEKEAIKFADPFLK